MYHLNPTPLDDTSPEAEAVLINLLRQAPSWRKLELMEQMRQLAYQLACSNIRKMHNATDERLVHRLLADRVLGEEMALRVYGSIEELISIEEMKQEATC